MKTDDVCMLVEGTYPYVAGGVSAWVHDIIRGHPELSFSVFNIGSHPGSYGKPRYELPGNVTGLHHAFCHDARPTPGDFGARAALENEIRAARGARTPRAGGSRVLGAMRRMHLGEVVDDQLLTDLMSGDLGLPEFLHGGETFDLLSELAGKLAPRASFLDLFWHFRAISVPILRLIASVPPAARCYHAVSTGYAGLVGTAFSLKTGRPLVVTEHGIYSRERNMELARATWITEQDDGGAELGVRPMVSPLRRLWSRSFHALARLAYHRASRIVTLSDINRRRQIADGAPAAKISVVPNGVDVPEAVPAPARKLPVPRAAGNSPLRVGFVGRVVPIKDVVSFIKACHLAMLTVDLDVRVIGPCEEDAIYARRCFDLVETLGRGASIKFLGPQPSHLIYADLDVVVLTSFSEGQPLVILEAYAAGLPVVATDVGACREMIEGLEGEDRRLGPSGIVTRVATPAETAAALVCLARDPALRQRLGAAGRARVSGCYRRHDMMERYRSLYQDMVAS